MRHRTSTPTVELQSQVAQSHPCAHLGSPGRFVDRDLPQRLQMEDQTPILAAGRVRCIRMPARPSLDFRVVDPRTGDRVGDVLRGGGQSNDSGPIGQTEVERLGEARVTRLIGPINRRHVSRRQTLGSERRVSFAGDIQRSSVD